MYAHRHPPPSLCRPPWPRRIALLALALNLLLGGCSTTYRVTLSNGTTITTANKPKFDSKASVYRFKDAQGHEHALPAFRVQEITPL